MNENAPPGRALIGFKGLSGLVSDVQPALKEAAKVAAAAAAKGWPAHLPVATERHPSPAPPRTFPPQAGQVGEPNPKMLGCAALMAAGVIAIFLIDKCDTRPATPRSVAVSPARPVQRPAVPIYARPVAAENGTPWPKKSGPIRGFAVRATGGYSTVTVDNTGGGGDVYAKLFALGGKKPRSVRTFFIKEGESYKVKDIRPGSYDVRYQDLDSGRMERTESFDLRQEETYEGVRYSNVTFTLYTVAGGNMRPQSISGDDFKDDGGGTPPASK